MDKKVNRNLEIAREGTNPKGLVIKHEAIE
jgi:hypothetical protein